MLLPALSRAKQKALGIACLNNLKQLVTASILYSGDYREFWPLNNPGDDAVNLANPPANYTPKVWAEGREGSNLIDEQTANGMVSDRVSLVAPYLKSKLVFRCPGDRKLTRVNNQLVTTPAQVVAAVDAARKAGRSSVLLLAKRGNTPEQFIGVDIGNR